MVSNSGWKFYSLNCIRKLLAPSGCPPVLAFFTCLDPQATSPQPHPRIGSTTSAARSYCWRIQLMVSLVLPLDCVVTLGKTTDHSTTQNCSIAGSSLALRMASRCSCDGKGVFL
ncbi:uncharacterized protein DS421_9g259350 [Arachis hypogaea]|nr:uncharacterized protein DS421_9g259350 [Arachis hypogaea]